MLCLFVLKAQQGLFQKRHCYGAIPAGHPFFVPLPATGESSGDDGRSLRAIKAAHAAVRRQRAPRAAIQPSTRPTGLKNTQAATLKEGSEVQRDGQQDPRQGSGSARTPLQDYINDFDHEDLLAE